MTDGKGRVLYLPMKKKWFDMILSGEKKEEYRLMTPHWMSRVCKICGFNGLDLHKRIIALGKDYETVEMKVPFRICFVNGYAKTSPRFFATVKTYEMRSSSRHPEWGEDAYRGQPHFAFSIGAIDKD